MPWPPRTTPIASGWSRMDRGDVETELESRPAPRNPGDAVAEAGARRLRAVRGGREGDAGVRMQVVDVVGVEQAVHGGVDGRRGATAPEEAVIERADHLVFALDARVHVHQARSRSSRSTARPASVRRAQVSAGALDPHQRGPAPGDRVDRRRPWLTCCRPRSWWCEGRHRADASARAARVTGVGVGSAPPAAGPPGRAASTLTRPTRPAGHPRVPRRSAPRSRIARRRPSGRDRCPCSVRSSASMRPHVGRVGVHQHAVRAQHVARPLRRLERRAGRPGAPWRWPPGRSSRSGSGPGSWARCCGTGRA